MRIARYIPLLLAGCVMAALCRGNEPTGPGPARAAASIAASDFRGAGSCSAVACHGSIKDTKSPLSSVRRNEHTTWMSSDKHSRAYAVLFDKKSDLIARRLAGSESEYTKAHEDTRCLACHTTPRPVTELGPTRWLNSDGVGCESCHGAAANYLGPHTTWEWKEKKRAEKVAKGFVITKDLRIRSEICAGCHVGEYSADGLTVRDVNHDLIAAGHPRLSFELTAYLENMPRHWDEKDEKDEDSGQAVARGPAGNFAARAWAIGRLTTIKAALAARATIERDRETIGRAGGSSRAPGWDQLRERQAGGTLAGILRIRLLLVPSRSARPGLAPHAARRSRGGRLTALGNLDLAWH